MNLPNKLTCMRLILIPFMMFFYLADFIPWGIGKIVALMIFAAAELTDWFDGRIARKRNLITNLGKFLDPIADKILTTIALILLIVDHTIAHPWGVIVAAIIIAREFAISTMRILAAKQGVVLAADWWGKVKTFVFMCTLPVFVLISYFNSAPFVLNAVVYNIILVIAYLGLIASVFFTVMSGINYLIKNKDCFKG